MMTKPIDQQVEDWFRSEENCDAANDFWGNRSFSHDDLPDFGEIMETWCRITPTHPIHPTVQ